MMLRGFGPLGEGEEEEEPSARRTTPADLGREDPPEPDEYTGCACGAGNVGVGCPATGRAWPALDGRLPLLLPPAPGPADEIPVPNSPPEMGLFIYMLAAPCAWFTLRA